MRFAIVGNQNCGKTTIFNEITNLNQHVGNFPGVTVENVSGKVNGVKNCEIIDLPGLYSLNSISKDENVTKDFLMNSRPELILNVVDSTNLSRNLFLTMQLKKTNIPIIVVLNMLDKYEKDNGKFDIKEFSQRLGLPVVAITNANQNEINNLINTSLMYASSNYRINMNFETDEYETILFYKKIEQICNLLVNKNSRQKECSSIIDKILTNKILGIPIFLLVMFSIFNITFNFLGPIFSDFINRGIEVCFNIIEYKLTLFDVNPVIHTFLIEGVFTGITSVLSFLPIIVILYFFLSFLEDSGYLTRIAFIMDGPLSRIGLSGRSIVPFLLGFGCSVPAILSIRTIQSERERNLALTMVPFISCSAKIPIYTILVSIFFRNYEAIAMIIIYSFGVFIGIGVLIYVQKKSQIYKKEDFMLELPVYRVPSLKNTIRLMWNKTKDFINKAFTVLFFSSIIIWFFKSFDLRLNYVQADKSILCLFAKRFAYLFKPIGLDDWRMVVSLIMGVTAKETILSTLSVFSQMNILAFVSQIFTTYSAVSFMVFVIFYTPCIASISIIKKEFGIKSAINVIIIQNLIAYIISFIVFNFLKILI